MTHTLSSSDSTRAAVPNNTALQPVPTSERVFNWHNHASLWFSLGVGLLVMQVGVYLVPAVGSRDAAIAIAIAIVQGSLIGAGLLAWTARLGCGTAPGHGRSWWCCNAAPTTPNSATGWKLARLQIWLDLCSACPAC